MWLLSVYKKKIQKELTNEIETRGRFEEKEIHIAGQKLRRTRRRGKYIKKITIDIQKRSATTLSINTIQVPKTVVVTVFSKMNMVVPSTLSIRLRAI